MKDLKFAPPSYCNGDGEKIVFVDFDTANYRLHFDVSKQSVNVRSEIEFDCGERGFPMFDLGTDAPLQVRLDGWPRASADESAPGTTAPFKIIRWRIDPGRHHLEVTHQLEDVSARPGPLAWYSGAVHCVFHMNDLDLPDWKQRFLGSYLPSNLEYDHYTMKMEVRIDGTSEEHVLITNEGMAKGSDNSWEIKYPCHFTTSFPWFDLFPHRLLDCTDGEYLSQYGRKIPLFVYQIKGTNVEAELSEFVADAKRHLSDLEDRYGDFFYDRLTVRGMSKKYGGMEHAGATASDLASLRHELDHCYFARGIAPVNGDAGWIDEAIASWGDNGYRSRKSKPKLPDAGLLAKSEYARVTNDEAYDQGAVLLAYLDFRLRKKGGLNAFLRRYAAQNKFRSVNVRLFKDMLEMFLGEKLDQEFEEYVGYPRRDDRPLVEHASHTRSRHANGPSCPTRRLSSEEIRKVMFDCS